MKKMLSYMLSMAAFLLVLTAQAQTKLSWTLIKGTWEVDSVGIIEDPFFPSNPDDFKAIPREFQNLQIRILDENRMHISPRKRDLLTTYDFFELQGKKYIMLHSIFNLSLPVEFLPSGQILMEIKIPDESLKGFRVYFRKAQSPRPLENPVSGMALSRVSRKSSRFNAIECDSFCDFFLKEDSTFLRKYNGEVEGTWSYDFTQHMLVLQPRKGKTERFLVTSLFSSSIGFKALDNGNKEVSYSLISLLYLQERMQEGPDMYDGDEAVPVEAMPEPHDMSDTVRMQQMMLLFDLEYQLRQRKWMVESTDGTLIKIPQIFEFLDGGVFRYTEGKKTVTGIWNYADQNYLIITLKGQESMMNIFSYEPSKFIDITWAAPGKKQVEKFHLVPLQP